jgi:hypothetical protein
VQPVVKVAGNRVILDSIRFGGAEFPLTEKWVFTVTGSVIRWEIERRYENSGTIDDNLFPCWQFESMNTWDGALLDNGGVAWNRFLANAGESYGTQAAGLVFWNRKTNSCLKIQVEEDTEMFRTATFSHRDDGTYSVTQASSAKPVPTLHGMYRFRTGGEKIYGPFTVEKQVVRTCCLLSVAEYDKAYDRGDLKGIDEGAVNEMFNTIGRYGVVDRNLYGSNGWRTGWTVLQEPWLALFGLAINSPDYITGFSQALDYAKDHAVMPDGRVLPRWHHDSTDAMPGTFRSDGFYECQWGYMLDAQPAFAINVAEQFDLTGDTAWLRRMKPVCESALGYMIRRDTDGNGLFEVIQNSWKEGKGTDWYDVVWASWEVASVNAYMYQALVRWSELELLMGDPGLAGTYRDLASRLKTAFNRSISDGGFWDPGKQWFVHWREKDGTAYGSNLNSMVNFLALGYGLCDDAGRRKAILDKMEELMLQEKLFIWPSCFYPYEERVGLAGVNYPWPNYENGDLFLSWAELGTRCYAAENPEIALKYIRNVIKRYESDGLAHQRYTRVAQTGAGDDILSNNIMAVIGLYRNIYGIRPQYNRLLLDPHLPAELAGTRLNYSLRGKDYRIELEKDSSTIRVENWSLTCEGTFALDFTGDEFRYFNRDDQSCSLSVSGKQPCAIRVLSWTRDAMSWETTCSLGNNKIHNELHNLEPGRKYHLIISGKTLQILQADTDGSAVFDYRSGKSAAVIRIQGAL